MWTAHQASVLDLSRKLLKNLSDFKQYFLTLSLENRIAWFHFNLSNYLHCFENRWQSFLSSSVILIYLSRNSPWYYLKESTNLHGSVILYKHVERFIDLHVTSDCPFRIKSDILILVTNKKEAAGIFKFSFLVRTGSLNYYNFVTFAIAGICIGLVLDFCFCVYLEIFNSFPSISLLKNFL